MNDRRTTVTLGLTRKSLEATVIHACPHCEAPGIFRADERTKLHWPGCYQPKLDGLHVGDRCPNCGKRRKANKYLGELSASMPKALWMAILGIKWLVIKLTTFTHRRIA